jgi:hypothetical protein
MTQLRHCQAFILALSLLLCGVAVAQSAPPDSLISNFRLQHGEGKVRADAKLNRMAREQAAAMAASDVLDHGVLGPFSARLASSGSGRAAENIAYGHDSFPKTLDQWITSSEHRRNLLMHGATRLGVASARSARSGRTYWAMVIAAEPTRKVRRTAGLTHAPDERCAIKLGNSLCLY